MSYPTAHPASFRDPSGFVFEVDGQLYRQVNQVYAEDYQLLMDSGLYQALTAKKQLIPHIEVEGVIADMSVHHKTLQPLRLPFISYPAEWSFNELKDAALLTLTLAREAVDHQMTLKDASPFNIQFVGGAPVHIDTLSFTRYNETLPWVAYSMFCRHFLFPLYIAHYTGTPVHRLMYAFPEGIPVKITAALLPLKSRLSLGTWLHVHLQKRVAGKKNNDFTAPFSRKKMVNLLGHLRESVEGLHTAEQSHWSEYYENTAHSGDYLFQKEKIFRNMIDEIPPVKVLDVGCNEGLFSFILAEKGHQVVSIDRDSAAINNLYTSIKSKNCASILPLVADIMNPTPSSGFENSERSSLLKRLTPDLVIALALIHHVVIGSNLPLNKIAELFAKIAPILLIEWIPRQDKKVQRMLDGREHIFQEYTQQHFEQEFSKHFSITGKSEAGSSGRFIYLMKKS